MAKKAKVSEDKIMEEEIYKVEEQETKQAAHEPDSQVVKRPKLNGRDLVKNPLPKPAFEQAGTDNQTREVIE